jgi:hypothetical protein
VELRRDPARGPRLGLAAGAYRYTAAGLASAQSNRWFRLDAGVSFAQGYSLDAGYEHAGGGSLPTHTARCEFARRF